MAKIDLLFLLNAIESALLELEELEVQEEWYISQSTDLLEASLVIIRDELEKNNQ